jgi:hypothetical protein
MIAADNTAGRGRRAGLVAAAAGLAPVSTLAGFAPGSWRSARPPARLPGPAGPLAVPALPNLLGARPAVKSLSLPTQGAAVGIVLATKFGSPARDRVTAKTEIEEPVRF